ncbi:RND family transporter [Mycobacterium paragordonae]|uniref:MMPL/RND family transporter n=1 Tax=Mycobacterium paragordonae TaxID=1389713 RepID=UPI001F0D0275|nr:RND family transporter [Mycobacterium paragordonae]
MSGEHVTGESSGAPLVARTIHRLAVPIILAWMAISVIATVCVPPLELVEKEHSVSLVPKDAPSFKALQRMDADFKESDSFSFVMVVLEGRQRLGTEAHKYYDELVRRLADDHEHVQHIQDFWADPLMAGAVQSADGKAAYVQLLLAGNPGETLGNESTAAVRRIVARTTPPPGVTVYVTGTAALAADAQDSGDKSVIVMTAISLSVIFVMLLLVYRSATTVILLLIMVGIELQVARGVVAFLGDQQIVGLTTFVVNLVMAVGIAAGTDYAIFFLGRYHEARQAGEDRQTAYYTAYRGVAKVVLASGLTIAGAIFCLSFTRLPYFQPLGIPCSLGIFVAVLTAVTMVPAAIAVGSRFGLFDPGRKISARRWRRVGTVVVRWPAPVLLVTLAVALIGVVTLLGYKPSYNDQKFISQNSPGNKGYAAVARHFPASRVMMPEVLLVEADHDLRNPADFLILNRLAKAVLAVPGISRVQSVTRPEGTPIEHASLPYLLSIQGVVALESVKFQHARIDDMLGQAEEMAKAIDTMQRMYSLMQQFVETNHRMIVDATDMAALTDELRDRIADFDDFWRPVRSYFYWEKHCYEIPVCWSLRSLYDSIDGVDVISGKFHELVADLGRVDAIMPELLTQFPPMIAAMQNMRIQLLSMHSTAAGMFDQISEQGSDAAAMGKAFDAAKNDDSFYLPPEVLENADFKRIMKVFLSPDGKAARMLITQRGDPASADGIARVDPIRTAAEEALKGTPLEHADIYVTGAAATIKDVVEGSIYDLLIAGIAALCLIFIVMLINTRSLVAALVIVGTVVFSLGASFGMSVLVWQYLVGIHIHWAVLAMSVIVLLAVGSDYNLLLVSRIKEEIPAGINTGIIRAMGGTGKVVTNAGLVFAFTMSSMVFSELRTIGQVGTTIGLGLLFDTLVVRAFMTPAIAALLGRWFWWPIRVRSRPVGPSRGPAGPHAAAASLRSASTP